MAVEVAAIQASLKLDASKFKQELKSAQVSMNDFSNNIKTGIKAIQGEMKATNTSIRSINTTIAQGLRNSSTSLNAVSSSLRKLGNANKGFNKDIQSATGSTVKTLRTMQNAVNSSTKSMTQNFRNANTEVSKMSGTISKAMKSVPGSIRSAQMAARTASASIEGTTRQASTSIQRNVREATKGANQMTSAFSNTKNMVQGILFSQAFYSGLNAVTGLVGGMFDMAKATESTEAAFTAMTKDAGIAKALVADIQDYANKSAFSFESATNASKQLLAYGFQINDIVPMLGTIGDAAAAMGNSEAFGRIARALGQIQTKGKVATQEVLQLTESGIPAFAILEEQLGLTKEQLGNLGKSGIQADVAIAALLNGIKERFGGAMSAMSMTVEGLMSNIKDSISYVGSQLFSPMYESFRGVLINMSTALSAWTETLRTQGIGGLFESIVPTELQEPIRLLLANLDMLRVKFMEIWTGIQPFIQSLLQVGISLLNWVIPPINLVLSSLSWLVNLVSQNTAMMQIFLGVISGLAVFFVISKAVALATAAFAGLMKIGGLIGVLVGVARSATLAAHAIQLLKSILSGPGGLVKGVAGVAAMGVALGGVSKTIGSIGSGIGEVMGADTSKQLQPVQNKLEDIQGGASNVNKELGNTSKALDKAGKNTDKLGKAAKKAGKEAKGSLASFDEIFQLADQSMDADTGIGKPSGGLGGGGGGLGDLGVPEIGMPSMDGLNDFLGDFSNTLSNGVKNAFDGAFKPETIWGLVNRRLKEGMFEMGELLSGIGGIFVSSFNTVIHIIDGVLRSIGDLFFNEGKNIGEIWATVGGKISRSWILTGANLKNETSNAMKQLQSVSQQGLNSVKGSWDLVLGTLPKVTKENLGATANVFAKNLKTLDNDSLTILRGTSDSMAVLFKGIRADMTEEQATKKFAKNLEIMRSSGMTEMNSLQKDFRTAMQTIDSNFKFYSESTRDAGQIIFGALARNAKGSVQEMSDGVIFAMRDMDAKSIENLNSMGGSVAQIFEGISSDSDLKSKETKDLVLKNLKQMEKDGVLNVDNMRKEFETKMKFIATKTGEQMNVFQGHVKDKTQVASAFAGTHSKLIAENIQKYVSSIPGQTNTQMTKMKSNIVNRLTESGVISAKQGENIKKQLLTPIEQTPGGTKKALDNVNKAINDKNSLLSKTSRNIGTNIGKGIVNGAVDALKNIGDKLWDAITPDLKWVTDKVNGALSALKKNMANTPVPVSGGGKKPGGGKAASGGLIKRHSIIQIGEGNRQEAVLPLENTAIMSAVGEAIAGPVAAALGNTMAGGLQMQSAMLARTTPVGQDSFATKTGTTVNAFVASDVALQELYRKLKIIADRERIRTLGTI